MLQAILALKEFAACIKDWPDTPGLRNVESSKHLLHGKSTSLKHGVVV